jgi:hypothetical protein
MRKGGVNLRLHDGHAAINDRPAFKQEAQILIRAKISQATLENLRLRLANNPKANKAGIRASLPSCMQGFDMQGFDSLGPYH